MDPNKALQEIREDLEDLDAAVAIEDFEAANEAALDVVVLFDGLDKWLSRGGFLPTAWATRNE